MSGVWRPMVLLAPDAHCMLFVQLDCDAHRGPEPIVDAGRYQVATGTSCLFP